MPYYDLKCQSCHLVFNTKATMDERSGNQIHCPSCGSDRLETVYKKVNILKYKGRECDACSGRDALPPCGSCPDGLCGLQRR